jgi:hypothetical protein
MEHNLHPQAIAMSAPLATFSIIATSVSVRTLLGQAGDEREAALTLLLVVQAMAAVSRQVSSASNSTVFENVS